MARKQIPKFEMPESANRNDDAPTTFFEMDETTKVVHEIDMFTGEIVLPEQAINLSAIEIEQRTWKYTPAIGGLICQLISEGARIGELLQKEGMPRAHIWHKWLQQHPELMEQYAHARKGRAEYYEDKIIAEAESADYDKDPIATAKLKIETWKWATAIDDSERYGNKTKISGDVSAPIQLIVSTGINREPLPEENKVVANGEKVVDTEVVNNSNGELK